MKKLKLFSLALMALFATSAWAADYYLINGNEDASTATLNTADFWTQGTFDAKSNGGNLKKCIVLKGNISAGITNVNYPSRYISYGVKTTEVTITITAYQSNNSAKKINIYEVNEAANGSLTVTNTQEKSVSKGLQTITFTATPAAGTRSTIYITSQAASNFEFYQVTASETGSDLANLKGGRAGYGIDYSKKSRLATKSGEDAMLDSVLYYHLSSDYKPNNGTSVNLKTGNYIKFKTIEPVKLTVVTTSAYTFYVAQTEDGTTNPTSSADTHNFKLKEIGEWYIIGGSSSATQISSIAFSAAPKITYNANGGSSSMDPSYFTVAANGFTAPASSAFVGWNTQADGKGTAYAPDDEVTEDVTLYAQWVQTYNVTYDANGGDGTMTDANSPYKAGDEVTLLANTFDAPDASSAWSAWDVYKTGEPATKVEVSEGKFTMPAYNVTVAAQWATAYDVKFFQGYGEPDVQIGETQSIGEGAFAVAPADPERAGYVFQGWSISASADDIKNVASYAITEATNFTAIWEQLFDITKAAVTNGSITVSAESAIEGATVTLTATPATDYLFDAWDVYKTGDAETKVEVNDGKFTMPAYAVTVSASFVTDTRTKILYLTTASTTNDKLYAALKDDYNVKVETPASQTLTNYALIVLHESLDGSTYYNNAAVAGCKTTSVPVLNTKSYFYTSARWNWGAPNAGKNVKGCSLNSTTYQYVSYHPIFADVVKDGFVEIIDEEEAKAMQPVGSFTSGLEGYTLATTPNASDGNGCAIHEIPAGNTTRGANTGKYLMISVSNSALGKLNANGQKLFQNAVAYLLSNNAWTPEFVPTALDNTVEETKAIKRIENGQVVIFKDGKYFNVLGIQIR